jgi:hypothetical protein
MRLIVAVRETCIGHAWIDPAVANLGVDDRTKAAVRALRSGLVS